MRRLLLALLLAGYGAVFVKMPTLGGGGRAFEPLDSRGREVESAIEEGRFGDALPIARSLASEHPSDPTVAFWLAETFKGLGQFSEEARSWERVFELTRLADAACPSLPEAYAHAGASDKVLDAYQRCASAGSDDPERWVDLARALANAGRNAEADAAFEKARLIDPTHSGLRAAMTAPATGQSRDAEAPR